MEWSPSQPSDVLGVDLTFADPFGSVDGDGRVGLGEELLSNPEALAARLAQLHKRAAAYKPAAAIAQGKGWVLRSGVRGVLLESVPVVES